MPVRKSTVRLYLKTDSEKKKKSLRLYLKTNFQSLLMLCHNLHELRLVEFKARRLLLKSSINFRQLK